ncbi:MAG TPA: endopeptidase La [Dehalococcoidia bacterium]|nr:endopeptidase La [Dehalococcoidia bacterium]
MDDTPREVKSIEEIRVPGELRVLPGRDTVIFPHMFVPMIVGQERMVSLINEAVVGDRIVGFFAMRSEQEHPMPEDLYQVGTAVHISRMLRMPEGMVQVLLQGVSRIRIVQIVETEPHIKARVEALQDVVHPSMEIEALTRNLLSLFQKVVSQAPNLPDEMAVAAMNIPEPGKLADFIASNLNLQLAEKQEILETLDVEVRLRRLTSFVNRELEILELGSKIQSQIRGEMDKTQRDYYLREQLKAIQKELGEEDERTVELNELRQKIVDAQLPPEVQKEAEHELDRLAKMPPAAAEYTVVRTYLDWMVSLPWKKSTEDNLDVGRARQILNEDHYDLEKVKDRILEYLAVRRLKTDMKGPILCFVGPAGVGKTSLGQSIARALGRKFMRISLGGVRDEAEIRGHRRTYVGALPGRIIQGVRRAESNNPVFMLDEIDKLGADFRGDPSAALLEVLDPAQNFAFVDHYLDVPFDLSKVMFITTANVLYTIPPALLDRMEVLELPGYIEDEKLQIARSYLVPRQMEQHGLTPELIEIQDDAISEIVRSYTREAGVRNLEREIATICRKVARQVAENMPATPSTDGETPALAQAKAGVSADNLHDFLGPKRFRYEKAAEEGEVGLASGLAWTETGGDVLFVEATVVPGKGSTILTGKLGDVMQESARAAVTYARSRAGALGLEERFYEKRDIHIHVPAGAIPKDGPSARITMAMALISALTRRPVRGDVGMTGEITLRGKVLPIGGIKNKVLAAHRAGLKTIILPKDNDKDLEEVPPAVREKLRFVFVDHMDDVLREALADRVVEEKKEPILAGV